MYNCACILSRLELDSFGPARHLNVQLNLSARDVGVAIHGCVAIGKYE